MFQQTTYNEASRSDVRHSREAPLLGQRLAAERRSNPASSREEK
jgi:hypothetical protein